MAKIVVLDDQPDVCKAIERRLSEDGHDVRTSHVGDEAIDFGYLFQPDILITDWRLGNDYDGLEVAEAFGVANENVKTILITGYSLEDIKKQGSPAKIYTTLRKPFSLEKIASVVKELLLRKSIDFSLN